MLRVSPIYGRSWRCSSSKRSPDEPGRPIEQALALEAYGLNSRAGKILEMHQEDPDRTRIVLIRQVVGLRWPHRVSIHRRSSAMRADIVPGSVFPDYALPDHTNTVRKLSELQGDDPLILTLARGHYCPKEHQQHLELAAFYPKIAVGYTQVATIATDEHHTLQEFRASVGAQWPFLSDPGRIVQKDLDIQEYTDPDNDPMIPHTIVLGPGLVVHRIYNGYWFWGRPSVVDLWHDLRDLMREIRPDWDLSTPGLREAWDSGDHALFHGWDTKPADAKTAG
jgi:peroxiredoxin